MAGWRAAFHAGGTGAAAVQPDFWREKWLVTEGKSRIEIALDLGDVKAGEFQEPICELELELLEGDANDVLKLARRLVNQSGLRQGSLSKAAGLPSGRRKCAARAERDDHPARCAESQR
ncbi:CYTH domain-containing protein [Enterobacter asburiae]|uniref:CYTH domain-containing protein n=1 Tax=Enterobacter asburiae TaxID=61645 RepID=UPI00387DC6EA